MIMPTAYPPAIPVSSLILLLWYLCNVFCKYQSANITPKPAIEKYKDGSKPKKNKIAQEIWPIHAPKHLAQNNICFLLIL